MMVMKFAFVILVLAATTSGEDSTGDREDISVDKSKRKLRTADVKSIVSRQADPKRLKDVIGAAKQLIDTEIKEVIGAAKKLIVEEIKNYPTTHNESSKGLRDMIGSEIRKYFANAELKQIEILNGAAGSDSHTGCSYDDALRAFLPISQYCAGCSSGPNEWKLALPHLVWYEFPAFHIPAKFTFRRYGQSSTDSQVPKTWKFVGSRDENCNQHSHWDELCGDLSGNLVYKVDVGCEVPKYAKRTAYKCLGIRVYSVPQARLDSSLPHHECFYNMRFWEAVSPTSYH